jgi:cytochrome c peroxidase
MSRVRLACAVVAAVAGGSGVFVLAGGPAGPATVEAAGPAPILAGLSLGNPNFSSFADDCPAPKVSAKSKLVKHAPRKARRAPRRRVPARKPAPSEALIARGQDLFEDEVVFGQRPSQDPHHLNQQISCATCHFGGGLTDGADHLVPTRDRRLALRQTPHLLSVGDTPRRDSEGQDTGGFGWDGRFPCAEAASQAAILNPTEMNSTRRATADELRALMAFMTTLTAPRAQPGADYDPELARRGERVFREERPAQDKLGGEFGGRTSLSCATCHSGLSRSDHKFHRSIAATGDPVLDPGRIDPDGNDPGSTLPALLFGEFAGGLPLSTSKGQITGFRTPALVGLRFTSPYFHEVVTGCSGTARKGLNCVVDYYESRFGFVFSAADQAALVEFLMSL